MIFSKICLLVVCIRLNLRGKQKGRRSAPGVERRNNSGFPLNVCFFARVMVPALPGYLIYYPHKHHLLKTIGKSLKEFFF